MASRSSGSDSTKKCPVVPSFSTPILRGPVGNRSLIGRIGKSRLCIFSLYSARGIFSQGGAFSGFGWTVTKSSE